MMAKEGQENNALMHAACRPVSDVIINPRAGALDITKKVNGVLFTAGLSFA